MVTTIEAGTAVKNNPLSAFVGVSVASAVAIAFTSINRSPRRSIGELFVVAMLPSVAALSTGYMGYTAKNYLEQNKVALDRQSKKDIITAGIVLTGALVNANINHAFGRSEFFSSKAPAGLRGFA